MDIQADIAAVQSRIAEISGTGAPGTPAASSSGAGAFAATLARALAPQNAARAFSVPMATAPLNPAMLNQPVPEMPSAAFIWPAAGPVSSPFGPRPNPTGPGYDFHPGIDIAADEGAPIHAAAPGRVVQVGPDGGYGNVVVIDHGNGVTTKYGHCSQTFATVGEQVAAGDEIAAVGSTGHSTGPHLHFEVRAGDKPIDPSLFLR
ncbi:MAG: M23 family metallopeptidase [Candidatus Baltobacteraceae bacterium]